MNPFLQSYLTTALRSPTGDDGEPLDKTFTINDIAPEAIERAAESCALFRAENAETLALAELTDERAGHNLWLNRNGHGSGFWDEYSQNTCDDYKREQVIAISTRKRNALDKTCNCKYHACQRLSEASKAMGEVDLYVGDDGQLYFS